MRIGFFEEPSAVELSPIARTRPAFELLCGRYSLRERVIRHLDVDSWGGFLRDFLSETYRETHPEAHVNDFEWLKADSTLMINAHWLPTLDALSSIQEDEVGFSGNSIVYLTLSPQEAALLSPDNWKAILLNLTASRRRVQAPGILVRYPWDLVNHNSQQLLDDFSFSTDAHVPFEPADHVALIGPADRVRVDPSAEIDPFVVFDARRGPITVDAGVEIHSFSQLQGPCHVGRNSQLFRAHLRAGTTIGPVCRVGGEIDSSILHGFVNKYHSGFLGHSYVCPWVNLGALTTNSDLKNDYSTVRVPLAGEMIESGLTKVGCFIGDYAKTAIGTLFNTGSSVGVMAMVLPDGGLSPKHIPPFSRFVRGEMDEETKLNDLLQTARSVMERRNQELSDAQQRLIKFLFDDTLQERETAILRHRENAHRRHLLPN